MTKLAHYMGNLVRYLRTTRAVSALEYAILLGVIAVAMAAALASFSDSIETGIEAIGDKIAAPGADDIKMGT